MFFTHWEKQPSFENSVPRWVWLARKSWKKLFCILKLNAMWMKVLHKVLFLFSDSLIISDHWPQQTNRNPRFQWSNPRFQWLMMSSVTWTHQIGQSAFCSHPFLECGQLMEKSCKSLSVVFLRVGGVTEEARAAFGWSSRERDGL